MTAHAPIEPRFVPVGVLDKRGKAGWPQIIALQAHVQVEQLNRRIREIEQLCDTCGAEPCVNPSFCDACRRADKRREAAIDYQANRPKIERTSAEMARLGRLLDDGVSLERAWNELNDPRNRPTPQSTIEAIMYCVRERGVAALKEPANVEWLSRCDATAKAEIDRRIAKLIAAKVING